MPVYQLPSIWFRASRVRGCHSAWRKPRTADQPSAPKHRTYATHRDALPTSSLLSQTLDQRQSAARGGDSAGPFQLGISQNSLRSGEKVKKWSELSTSGKVTRAAARSTNFTVIFLGAGLTAVLVYALTTELFSRNSPTVRYGEACELIKASPKVAQYLQLPLSFHNNPPSSSRPRHRNHHVSHQLAVDSAGREHLLLNFYVRGSRPGSPVTGDENDSYLDRAQASIASLSDLTWEDTVDWAKSRYHIGTERCKSLFLYLTGQPPGVTHTRTQDLVSRKDTQIGRPSKEDQGLWSFAGLFSGLRSKKSASQQDAAVFDKFEEGEIHADLVKDDQGNFVWRYIMIDLPYTRSWRPTRIFIEKGSDVRESESVMTWN